MFIPRHADGHVEEAFWRLLRTFDPDVVSAVPDRVVDGPLHQRILANCAPLHQSDEIYTFPVNEKGVPYSPLVEVSDLRIIQFERVREAQQRASPRRGPTSLRLTELQRLNARPLAPPEA